MATTRSTAVGSQKIIKNWRECCKSLSKVDRARMLRKVGSVLVIDNEALMCAKDAVNKNAVVDCGNNGGFAQSSRANRVETG